MKNYELINKFLKDNHIINVTHISSLNTTIIIKIYQDVGQKDPEVEIWLDGYDVVFYYPYLDEEGRKNYWQVFALNEEEIKTELDKVKKLCEHE